MIHIPFLWRTRRETPPAPKELKVSKELADRLLETGEGLSPFFGVDGKTETPFDREKCKFCQGVHTSKCPAVKEIEYFDNGSIKRVVYFPHGEWPVDDVIWLEDLIEAQFEDGDDEPLEGEIVG